MTSNKNGSGCAEQVTPYGHEPGTGTPCGRMRPEPQDPFDRFNVLRDPATARVWERMDELECKLLKMEWGIAAWNEAAERARSEFEAALYQIRTQIAEMAAALETVKAEVADIHRARAGTKEPEARPVPRSQRRLSAGRDR